MKSINLRLVKDTFTIAFMMLVGQAAGWETDNQEMILGSSQTLTEDCSTLAAFFALPWWYATMVVCNDWRPDIEFDTDHRKRCRQDNNLSCYDAGRAMFALACWALGASQSVGFFILCVQAIPILNDALSALDTIKEADIAYIKKLQNPPGAIKLVMEAICVVLDVKPVKVRS